MLHASCWRALGQVAPYGGARRAACPGAPSRPPAEVLVRAFALVAGRRQPAHCDAPNCTSPGCASARSGISDLSPGRCPRISTGFTQLASSSVSFEEYAGAESAYRRALAIQEKALGDGVGVCNPMERALTVTARFSYEERRSFTRAEPLIRGSRSDQRFSVKAAELSGHDARQRGNYRLCPDPRP